MILSVFSTVMLWRIQIESRSQLSAGPLSIRTGQPVDLGHSSVMQLLPRMAGPVLLALTSRVNTGNRAVLPLCFVVERGPGNLDGGVAVAVLPAGCSWDTWAASGAAVSWAPGRWVPRWVCVTVDAVQLYPLGLSQSLCFSLGRGRSFLLCSQCCRAC